MTKTNILGAGAIVPLVKCLLYKHDDQSLDPQGSSHKIFGVMVYTFNHSTGEG